MQQSKSDGATDRLLSIDAAVYNTFAIELHLISRRALRILRGRAHQAWAGASPAAG